MIALQYRVSNSYTLKCTLVLIFETLSWVHIFLFCRNIGPIAGAASQAGDSDSYQAPGLTSCFEGFLNVNCAVWNAVVSATVMGASVLLDKSTLHIFVQVTFISLWERECLLICANTSPHTK